jgi:ABC-2 type transport system permease protein
MRAILAIALKDIRLLLRDRMAAFFVLIFPLLMGLFFGLVITPSATGSKAKMRVAIVDQDLSKYSRLLIGSLQENNHLAVEMDQFDQARKSVQAGNRTALIVIPQGFGETAGLLWEQQAEIQLGVDPSRASEGAMLEGFIMEAVGGLIGKRLSNPDEMLGMAKRSMESVRSDANLNEQRRGQLLDFFAELDGFVQSLSAIQTDRASGDQVIEQRDDEIDGNEQSMGFRLAAIDKIDVTQKVDPNSREGQLRKLRSRWDISFPQAMLWGILGCVAGFAISLAQEREAGTLFRLYVAPISRSQLLSGKALACFLSVIAVIILITICGFLLGMRPLSTSKLAFAAVAVAVCFVGIMMTLSTLGRSVQSVSSTGWAANMIMAMIGGCMIPVMFMPEFIARLSIVSPVRWAILSLEGAIWRDFSWPQLAANCGVLVAIGVVSLAFGVVNNSRWEN